MLMSNEINEINNLITITNRSRQKHFFNVHMAFTTKYKHVNKIEM